MGGGEGEGRRSLASRPCLVACQYESAAGDAACAPPVLGVIAADDDDGATACWLLLLVVAACRGAQRGSTSRSSRLDCWELPLLLLATEPCKSP